LIKKGSNKIILDAYNANPNSMQAALENFAKQELPNKMVMLGAMMELGQEAPKEHQLVVDLIKKMHFSKVILVGGDFEQVQHPFLFFKNVDEACGWIKSNKPADANILIKGSRSTKMEKLLDVL
jgi:UDP-N-acetylmuramoyl-tripeptide--D-alanyl-D-alanine ligase